MLARFFTALVVTLLLSISCFVPSYNELVPTAHAQTSATELELEQTTFTDAHNEEPIGEASTEQRFTATYTGFDEVSANKLTIDVPESAGIGIVGKDEGNNLAINNITVATDHHDKEQRTLKATANNDGVITFTLSPAITLHPGDDITVNAVFEKPIQVRTATIRAFLEDAASSEEEATPGTPDAPGGAEESDANKENGEARENDAAPSEAAAAGTERAAASPAQGTMIAQGGMELGPATTTGTTNATVQAMVRTPTLFQKAVVTVTADNVNLEAWSRYYFHLTNLQPGFELGSRILSRSANEVIVEFYPMQDGQSIESMYVTPNAVASVNAQLGNTATNVKLDVVLHGTKFKRTEPAPTDGYDYLEDPFPNPPLTPKCGQRVAIVFDLSTSVIRTNKDQITGPERLATAGQNAIDALAGTATEVALFNFGTHADRWQPALQKEPLALDNPNNVAELKQKIETFKQIPPLETQGTNWEDALQSVIDTGTHFDAVYFITDGIPTHAINGMPGDSPVGASYVTDHEDLNAAIKVANELKRSQTRLEVIGYSVPYREYLLKWGVYPTRDAGITDNWSKGDYYLGGALTETLMSGSNIQVFTKNGQPIADESVWTYGRLYGEEFIELLLGKNEDGKTNNDGRPYAYTPDLNLNNFAEDLRSKIIEGCSGKLIVNKTLVDRHGKVLGPGENWTFNVASADGAEVIRDGVDWNFDWEHKAKLSKATSKAGRAEFDIKASKTQQMDIAEVIPEDSGYQLYKQGGKNAVCHIVTGDPATGSTTYTPVDVTDDGATGFKVNLPFDEQMQGVKTVSCEVQNYKDSTVDLKLKKVDYEDKTQPLDGAEFKVYAANEAFQLTEHVVAEMKNVDKDGYLTAELEPDIPYYLVETRSPAGYMLLAQPVLFKIVVEDDEATVKFYTVVKDDEGNDTLEETETPVAGVGVPSDEESTSTEPSTEQSSSSVAFMHVADVRQGELPKTGGLGVGAVAGAGLLIVIAGMLMARRRA